MTSFYDPFLRFVIDACKRLREPKSYLMYTAVGCLGVAALSDLIKEVNCLSSFCIQASLLEIAVQLFAISILVTVLILQTVTIWI